jgi:hypothetical protein
MTLRRFFLMGRAAGFVTLLLTAGVASISVASDAGDARPMSITGNVEVADPAGGIATASR